MHEKHAQLSSNRPSSPVFLSSFSMDTQPTSTRSLTSNEQATPQITSSGSHASTLKCQQIHGSSNKVTVLPSEAINKLPVDVVLKTYPKLKGASRAGELAVKLAMEAFFGEQVLTKCTVKGCRNLQQLK